MKRKEKRRSSGVVLWHRKPNGFVGLASLFFIVLFFFNIPNREKPLRWKHTQCCPHTSAVLPVRSDHSQHNFSHTHTNTPVRLFLPFTAVCLWLNPESLSDAESKSSFKKTLYLLTWTKLILLTILQVNTCNI